MGVYLCILKIILSLFFILWPKIVYTFLPLILIERALFNLLPVAYGSVKVVGAIETYHLWTMVVCSSLHMKQTAIMCTVYFIVTIMVIHPHMYEDNTN